MVRARGASAPPRLLLPLLLLPLLPLLLLPLLLPLLLLPPPVAPRARDGGAASAAAPGPDRLAVKAYPSLDGRPIVERRQDSLDVPAAGAPGDLAQDPIFEHRQDPLGRAYPSSERDLIFERWHVPLDVPEVRVYQSSKRHPIFEGRHDPLGNDYSSSESGQVFEPRRDPLDMPVGEAHGGSQRDPVFEHQRDPLGRASAASERGRMFEHRRNPLVGRVDPSSDRDPIFKGQHDPLEIPAADAHGDSEQDPISEQRQDLLGASLSKPEEKGPVIIIPVDKTGEGVDSEKDGARHHNTQKIYITALSVTVTGFLLAMIYILALHWRIKKQEPALPSTDVRYETEHQNMAKSRQH